MIESNGTKFEVGYCEVTLNSFARISINQLTLQRKYILLFYSSNLLENRGALLCSVTCETHFCWNHTFHWAPFYTAGSPLSCCGHRSSARRDFLITSDGRSSSAAVSLFCWSLDISLAGYAIFLLEASLFCRASPTSP